MKKTEKFSTDCLFKTKFLKEIIVQNPDLPLLIIVSDEANIGEYQNVVVWDIGCTKGEYLDCYPDVVEWKRDKAYTDRDDFEEDIEEYLADLYEDMPDKEFKELLQKELAEYEPYWTPCLILSVG